MQTIQNAIQNTFTLKDLYSSRKVTIAYVPQKPWLMNASLQDNILFGQTMEPRRYKRVLQACSLNPDISILPAGERRYVL